MATTYTYPFTSDAYRPEAFSLRVEDFVQVSTPAMGGPIRTYEVPGSRLVASMTYGVQTLAERREIAGFWAKGGQRRNRVLLYHPAIVAPAGTMRGSPQINAAASAGAESVSIKSMTGTLLRGDPIGIGGYLYLVTDDATPAGGVATVNIAPQLRVSAAINDAVVWDRPTGSFMVLSAPDVPFIGSRDGHPRFTVQLMEA